MSHILIIEDDISIANLQRDYLEINQMSVTLAHDGNAGLALAQQRHYDLIIVDVMLPGLDGFEICKEIRKSQQTPIIIVSAKSEDIDKIRGLGLGADDYLSKPFSPNELVARVKARIQRYQELTQQHGPFAQLQQGALRINKSAHKAYWHEHELTLTTKEFSLLLFLAEHPQRVWSKEQLFEQVWGSEALDLDVSTVVVHIKRIREKIKQAGATTTPIETIWGSGYLFNA